MSLWTRITDALAALGRGDGLSAALDHLRSPPERTVAFTIAVIALGAKMAKADGRVTRDEVAAFRRIFTIAPEDEAAAARVFDLARQDIAGYETWAARIARMFADDRESRLAILDGLFHIAMADGTYAAAEDRFLARVAEILDLRDCCFRSLRAQHVPGATPDPYDVLDVDRNAPLTTVRAAWKAAVRANHPDGLAARGVPAEARDLAAARLIAVNAAWEEISRAHAGA